MAGKVNMGLVIVAVFLGGTVLLCGGCFVIGLIGMAVNPLLPPPMQPQQIAEQPPKIVAPLRPSYSEPGEFITKEEYDRISNGMTYKEVVNVVGSNGLEVPRSRSSSRFIMEWKNVNEDGVNATVTFEDGLVVSKTETNLPSRPGSGQVEPEPGEITVKE